MKIVRVKWVDAFSTDAWTDFEDLSTDSMIATTVGFLVKELPNLLIVASTVSRDRQACCTMHIPKGWIMEREDIGERDDAC